MLKYIGFLLFFINFSYALKEFNISLNVQDINITQLSNFLKKNDPYYKYLNEKSIKDNLNKKINAIKKINSLNEKDKLFLRYSLINSLYKIYINKLEDKLKINNKILKSFYITHKNLFYPIIKVNIAIKKFFNISKADEFYSHLVKKKKLNLNLLEKKYNFRVYKEAPLDFFDYKIRFKVEHMKNNCLSTPIKLNDHEYVIIYLQNKKEYSPTFKNVKPNIKEILLKLKISEILKGKN